MTLATRVAVMNDGVIRQIGVPEDIYNDPADTFVAGFIGSPAMNLLSLVPDGRGACRAGELPLRVSPPRPGPVVLGIRSEDLELCSEGEALWGCEVYTFELLGDSTLLTAMIGDRLVAARAGKSVRLSAGARVWLRCSPDRLYWFDGETGLRIR